MEHPTDRASSPRPHHRIARWLGCLVLGVACPACGSDQQLADAGSDLTNDGALASDSGSAIDAALVDGSLVDGSNAVDAPTDAPSASVNGCTSGAAQNFTAVMLTVTFPGLSYSPKCARIRAGQAATFTGTFSSHPLRAGIVTGGTVTPAAGSPILAKSSGSTVTYSFPNAGTFPYYCDFHYGAGMTGVIYVDP